MRRICALALLGGAAAAAVRRDRAQALEALFDDPSTVDHDFAPSVPLRPLASTAPSVTVELPDLERGLKAKVPGRGVSTWGDALEPPYFTCERDCMGLLPELEIRAPPPVPDVALADYRVDLNTHRELGPRVPCVPNWDVWDGVGDPGCTVDDLGGRNCGPGSEFEFLLLYTCSRLCVQKFEANEGCPKDGPGQCNPTWTLHGYDKPYTCERQCDACVVDPAQRESTCAAGADLAAKRPSGEGVAEWRYFPLAHRGPRRPASDPDGATWAGELTAAGSKGFSKAAANSNFWLAVLAELDKQENVQKLSADYNTVLGELDNGGCKGGPAPQEACKLPSSAGERSPYVVTPAMDVCPCECSESLRTPGRDCINAFVQARGTPATPLPMESADCKLMVREGRGGGGKPLETSSTDDIKPPPPPVTQPPVEKEKNTDAEAAAKDAGSQKVQELAAAAQERAHRLDFQSEQMEEAGIPSIREGAKAKKVNGEWLKTYSSGDKIADSNPKPGSPFSDGNWIDTEKGIAPATEAAEVRPLAAAEACWCQGAIQQPRGFEWSDYYSQYYGALRSCEARTCQTCLVLVNEWWRNAEEARPEEACSQAQMPDSRVCVDMMVDLQETSPALKQAVSWEIAAGIQNPQSVGQKTALNQLEDEDAWKVMHQLIDKGVKTACVQLGCCQSSGI